MVVSDPGDRVTQVPKTRGITSCLSKCILRDVPQSLSVGTASLLAVNMLIRSELGIMGKQSWRVLPRFASRCRRKPAVE